MKITIITAALLLSASLWSCKKHDRTPVPNTNAVSAPPEASAACAPLYYNLVWDPAGTSNLYKISGSPSAGPVVVTPVLGSLGTSVIGGATPVTKVTGLAYDPATGTAWAVTGNSGSNPNSLIRFAIGNPNVVTITPLTTACGITLNLSDIERDQTTGVYYAINISSTDPNNRIVTVNPSTGVVSCLPNFISLGIKMRGLTFGCNGQLYVLYTIGDTGVIININKTTGAIITSYSYTGPITPGGVGNPDAGLHFDCTCIGRFITGSLTGGPLLTNALPSALGGPSYASVSGIIKPTVDFARP